MFAPFLCILFLSNVHVIAGQLHFGDPYAKQAASARTAEESPVNFPSSSFNSQPVFVEANGEKESSTPAVIAEPAPAKESVAVAEPFIDDRPASVHPTNLVDVSNASLEDNLAHSEENVDYNFNSYKSVACYPQKGSSSQSVFCVRYCQEIEDFKTEAAKNKQILQATKHLLENTVRYRKCSNGKEKEKHYCSQPEPENPFQEGTYLFVTAGWNNQKQIADTELVDLSDSLNHCKTLPEYLKRVQSSVAGYVNNEYVVVCGGNVEGYKETPISDCLKLDTKQNSGSWIPIENMKEERSYAASTVIPSLKRFFVTGGTNVKLNKKDEQMLSTTEYLDFSTDKWIPGPPLPHAISHHCLVQLDDYRTVLIGGSLDSKPDSQSNQVWILDWNQNSKEWTKGPNLKYGRVDHACGVMTLESGEDVIVVAGGRWIDTVNATVEMIKLAKGQDLSTTEWFQGPELPFHFSGSELTQVPLASGEKGLLLVGGYKQILLSGWGLGFSSDIYLIRDRKTSPIVFEWENLRSKLRIARFESAVAVIHKDNFDCSV